MTNQAVRMPATSNQQIRIRPACAADRPAIMQMLQSLPAFKPQEIVVAEEVLDSYLADPGRSGYHALVAELEDRAAGGYVCYGPVPLCEGTWDIYWLAVDARAQGRGMGTALLRSAEQHAQSCCGRMIMIETSSRTEYAAAQWFYASQGYAVVSDIADFYAPGDNRLIYCKHLV